MAEGDSPTSARRRVRLAIREAREAAKLTQQQVAEEMEWSLSKVFRIESGEVTVSVNDYSVDFIPGRLQTPAYAAALLEMFGDEIPPMKRDALLEARRLRHDALLSTGGGTKVFALLDESVLRRPLGGQAVDDTIAFIRGRVHDLEATMANRQG